MVVAAVHPDSVPFEPEPARGEDVPGWSAFDFSDLPPAPGAAAPEPSEAPAAPPTTPPPPPTTTTEAPAAPSTTEASKASATTAAPVSTTVTRPPPKPEPPPEPQPEPAPVPAALSAEHGDGTQEGMVSWYDLPGSVSGVCAHRTIEKGTVVTVTNLDTGESITCTVDDRGPYSGDGKVLDLHRDEFSRLAPLSQGIFPARLDW